MIIRMSEYDAFTKGISLTVGTEYIVTEKTDTTTGTVWHELREPTPGGIPGNMDASIRRYHGWRGTTNNVSTYALGLRKVEAVTTYKNGSVKVTMSDDLLPNEP